MDLHCVVEQHLLHICDSINYSKLLKNKTDLNMVGKDYHKESLIVSMSPTGEGGWKLACCEDNISLSISLRRHYVKFQISPEEPIVKCVHLDSPCVLDALLENAAKQDCLPTTQPIVISTGNLFSSSITTEGSALHGTVFMATKLYCYDHVESAY